jgi:hypothetical protein
MSNSLRVTKKPLLITLRKPGFIKEKYDGKLEVFNYSYTNLQQKVSLSNALGAVITPKTDQHTAFI